MARDSASPRCTASWRRVGAGEGTTFTVLLPVVAEPAQHGTADAEAPAAPGGPARVLVVDDEEPVRQVMARILVDSGYLVATARHGREAASLLATPAGRVELVVSDVVMPVAGGGELREILARSQPRLPVIWISGYPRDAVMEEDALGDDQVFLQKPVSVEALLSAVARLTGRDGARESG